LIDGDGSDARFKGRARRYEGSMGATWQSLSLRRPFFCFPKFQILWNNLSLLRRDLAPMTTMRAAFFLALSLCPLTTLCTDTSFVTPTNMKIVCLLTAIAGTSAFAPVSQPARATSHLEADLSGIRGVGPETAGKIVSRMGFAFSKNSVVYVASYDAFIV
jgi:hypothetical protein